MLARLATAALVGLTAHPVGVEVDIGRGLPAVTVVGLGGTAVLEARDRLRAAFGNTGYEWPDRRITVSLPPADLPKQGSGFDLPIAIGLLAAAGSVPPTALEGLWAIGNGMRALSQDDAEFVERMRPVYDALYEYCKMRHAGSTGWTSDT